MERLILSICVIFIFLSAKSQMKEISGDTTFWYKYNKGLYKKFDLQNILESKQDFNFRLCNQGQIIDINNDNNFIQGYLINYAFKEDSKNYKIQDTIFTKIAIEPEILFKIHKLIIESGILQIKSDKEIPGWSQGVDGITYIIEYSDKRMYSFKTYWSPSIQDSTRDVLVIKDFIEDISNLLELKDSSNKFMEKLSKRNGCYSRGGMIRTCFHTNNYQLGYSGSIRLPVGYVISTYIEYVSNIQTDVGFVINHQFGKHHSYDFSARIGKNFLFLRNYRKTKDFLIYAYQQRKLHYIDEIKSQHHKILYGISFNNLSVAMGYSNLNEDSKRNGCFFSVNKVFFHPDIGVYGEGSIFDNRMDFKIGIGKYLNILNNLFSNGVNIELHYENFRYHGNVGTAFTFYL